MNFGPLPLATFAEVIGGTLRGPASASTVSSVSIHSGRIRPGAAFFALRGDRADGHGFVTAAAAHGAAVSVVAKRAAVDAPVDHPVVEVDDPLLALQRLAGWWRGQLSGTVVAIVGSKGKTTTKDCLVHLLGHQVAAYGSPGSYNSQLGVPLALLGCPADAEVAVIEVAVSEPGEMGRLAPIVRADHVVVTNLGTRWMSQFDDRRHQVSEMLQVADRLGEGGWVLVGDRDPDLTVLSASAAAELIEVGASDRVPQFDAGATPARWKVTFGEAPPVAIRVDAPNEEIAADVRLAASAAWLLGVSEEALTSGLASYAPTVTRMEIWRSPAGIGLVRDIATPDAMSLLAGLRATRRLVSQGGSLVVVLAQDTSRWPLEQADEFARALAAEQIDELCIVRSPFNDRVAELVEASRDRRPIVPRRFEHAGQLRDGLIELLEPGDACLLESPPSHGLDDLANTLVEAMAPTRLYIDLAAVDENVGAFRRAVGGSVKILAMVKALAYGTDAISVSLALQQAGVDGLGVSGVDEGVSLRQADINLPILVLLGTATELPKMVRYGLTPVIHSTEMLHAVLDLDPPGSDPIGVHLEVDSGMHRAGLSPEAAIDALHSIRERPSLRLDGLMTHLACADDPAEDAFTDSQLDRFRTVVAAAKELGLDPTCHAAATASAARLPRAHFDMVRVGLGLYGLHPSPASEPLIRLAPAASLVSRVVQMIDVPPGERVGYGGTFRAPAEGARIGVVPAGYHDCIPRAFSNSGTVIVAGVACPIVGTVSMDSMTVDLTHCPDAEIGSDVLIYGVRGQGQPNVPLGPAAAVIGTISYELMARVGPRVQRIVTRH